MEILFELLFQIVGEVVLALGAELVAWLITLAFGPPAGKLKAPSAVPTEAPAPEAPASEAKDAETGAVATAEQVPGQISETARETPTAESPEPVAPPGENQVGVALLHIACGAAAGGFSLLAFPQLFLAAGWGRIANLLLTPFAAGAAMTLLGEWRERYDKPPTQLNSFWNGYFFALAMALVRFYFGR